jgi:ribose/xylose/arabinose/galactoside ABC-type transport system permease subunit
MLGAFSCFLGLLLSLPALLSETTPQPHSTGTLQRTARVTGIFVPVVALPVVVAVVVVLSPDTSTGTQVLVLHHTDEKMEWIDSD